jgi:hypothetical protein
MRAGHSSWATALLLGATLAGCGGGTETVTVPGPPQGGAQAAGTSTAAKTTATTAIPVPARVVHLDTFRSPTGNIGCSLLDNVARCDIEKRSWHPPARPASCPEIVDFGQGLEVGASGAARFVCAGDTARDPASPVLVYGSGSRIGGVECVSATAGITCAGRAEERHGFFISIQTYRIF